MNAKKLFKIKKAEKKRRYSLRKMQIRNSEEARNNYEGPTFKEVSREEFKGFLDRYIKEHGAENVSTAINHLGESREYYDDRLGAFPYCRIAVQHFGDLEKIRYDIKNGYKKRGEQAVYFSPIREEAGRS